MIFAGLGIVSIQAKHYLWIFLATSPSNTVKIRYLAINTIDSKKSLTVSVAAAIKANFVVNVY